MTEAGPVYLHDGIPCTGLLIPNANAVHHCLGHWIPPRVATLFDFGEKVMTRRHLGGAPSTIDHVGLYALRNSVHRLVR